MKRDRVGCADEVKRGKPSLVGELNAPAVYGICQAIVDIRVPLKDLTLPPIFRGGSITWFNDEPRAHSEERARFERENVATDRRLFKKR